MDIVEEESLPGDHRHNQATRTPLQEFLIFQLLLHTGHIVLSVTYNKRVIDLCNDTVFIAISATTIFFISFPWMIWNVYQQIFYRKLERRPRLKKCPYSLYSDSCLYLLCYLFPIVILIVLDFYPWNSYSVSTRDIPKWSLELWGIFVLNSIITIPIVCYNLRQSYLNGELRFHLLGYVLIVVFLFLPYLIHTRIHLHLHHWFISLYMSLFSRFPTRISRSFHAICMGIFIHGVSLYRPDPVFVE